MRKKNLFLSCLFIVITMFSLAINIRVSQKNGTNYLLLENVEALASSETGGSSGTFTCYSTYNNCWFWNCSTIYRCGNPCTDATADDYSDSGTCRK